jgi:hypothetical protein
MNRTVGTHKKRQPILSSQVPCLTVIAGIRHAGDREGEAAGSLPRKSSDGWLVSYRRRKCEMRSVVQDCGARRRASTS